MNSFSARGKEGAGLAAVLLAALMVVACLQPPALAITEDEDHWNVDFSATQQSLDRTVSLYNPPDREHDPFLPVVRREPQPVPFPAPDAEDQIDKSEDPLSLPPLRIGILCIVGNASRRLALVEHEGNVQEMAVGDEIPNQFKVMGIGKDSVEVFSYTHRGRRSFPLGAK